MTVVSATIPVSADSAFLVSILRLMHHLHRELRLCNWLGLRPKKALFVADACIPQVRWILSTYQLCPTKTQSNYRFLCQSRQQQHTVARASSLIRAVQSDHHMDKSSMISPMVSLWPPWLHLTGLGTWNRTNIANRISCPCWQQLLVTYKMSLIARGIEVQQYLSVTQPAQVEPYSMPPSRV